MIDIHSHVINNLDDGSRSIEESINILKNLSNKGVTDIIFTPHYIVNSNYQVSYTKKNKAYNDLLKEIKKEKININTYLGNEIYIDLNIINYIKIDRLSLNNSKYILLEFPMNGKYNNQIGIIEDLIEKGYKVILAHPERYLTIQDNFKLLDEYKKIGVLLQINIGSLYNMYGHKAKKTVKKILKKQYASFIASDIHHSSFNFDYFNDIEKKLLKITKNSNYVNQILYLNAKNIIK